MPKMQEQFPASHRDVVNAENAGAISGKPQGRGEHPSRGCLVPKIQEQFPAAQKGSCRNLLVFGPFRLLNSTVLL